MKTAPIVVKAIHSGKMIAEENSGITESASKKIETVCVGSRWDVTVSVAMPLPLVFDVSISIVRFCEAPAAREMVVEWGQHHVPLQKSASHPAGRDFVRVRL